MPAVAFADIGKAPKELLTGAKSSGVFQLDPKLTVATTTSTGVTFTATAVQKADKVDATLKAAYSTKKYSVDATIDPSSKISVNASLSGVAPGVKLTTSAVVPDVASTAKVGVEYANPYVHVKSTVAVKASPVLDIAVATGYKTVLLGGEATYDAGKALLSKYTLGVGYHAPDFQVAAYVADKLSTLKLSYAHNLAGSTVVGAEVTRKLTTADTSFALAYQKRLANGSLTKAKIDNSGLLSLLYETKLAGGEKIAGSLQLQATDFSKAPKYGFALDFS